jgi:hypothetical protein
VVVVHDAELLAEANDATSTTTFQLVLQSLKEILTGSAATGRGATNISPENLTGELTVVQSTTPILVIDLEEGVKILSGRDQDANFFTCLGELVGLN